MKLGQNHDAPDMKIEQKCDPKEEQKVNQFKPFTLETQNKRQIETDEHI